MVLALHISTNCHRSVSNARFHAVRITLSNQQQQQQQQQKLVLFMHVRDKTEKFAVGSSRIYFSEKIELKKFFCGLTSRTRSLTRWTNGAIRSEQCIVVNPFIAVFAGRRNNPTKTNFWFVPFLTRRMTKTQWMNQSIIINQSHSSKTRTTIPRLRHSCVSLFPKNGVKGEYVRPWNSELEDGIHPNPVRRSVRSLPTQYK